MYILSGSVSVLQQSIGNPSTEVSSECDEVFSSSIKRRIVSGPFI